ncbi:unnamed protein product [Somion occarium]|uniref:P-loop containing nucleoside triphosphate hydrolase protein n=1 Tax=Somion occarium TaxID=3059160 RepID=A0ABP1DME2_9APHY
MSSCSQDSSFGPGSSCRNLDFTLFFEQSILSFTPDVVFVVFACIRLVYLWYQTNKLASVGWIHIAAKALLLCMILSVNAASLKYSLDIIDKKTFFLWIPALVMQLVSAVPLAVLVVAEHFRSSNPSMIIICYTLVKGLFTAAAVRSHLQIGVFLTAHAFAVLTALSAASYLSLLCVETVEKRRLLRRKTLPTVSTASFLSRSLCFWLIPLLWTGRKKTLTIDDCGVIPDDLSAQSTGGKLHSALYSTRKGTHYLLIASFKAFGLQFIAPILPRVLLLLATFGQPLLVNQTISFVSDPGQPAVQGWALVGGFICIYALITITTSLYWEKAFNATVQYRGALVSNIYKKSLKLSSTKSRSLGSGVASTYMSVDVERICEGMEYIHEMWAALLSIALSIVILYSQATWPAFLPIAVTLLLMLAAGIAGRKTGVHQNAWLGATDKRVKFLSSIIHKFLPIKWSRYEGILAEKAAEFRAAEMNRARSFYNLVALMAAVSNSAGTLCILSVLGPYAALAARGDGAALDPNRLFTIVTTVNLLSSPLNILGQYMPSIFAAYASIKRIESFLLFDEKEDNADSDKGSSEKAESEELTSIKMVDAVFAWSPDSEPFLQDININLCGGQLHLCTGPVASGKSLLLLSILRECSLRTGQYIPPQGRIAYASQDALIIPGSVRENIIFGLPFDEERYLKVVDACALRHDLNRLKAGDQTILGEKGGTLSGGQKQRIALARAIYADAPWTLLDDPLSALDAETETHIFQSLFSQSGILKNKSVLLVTHNLKHISSADNVIVLNVGRIQYQGPPEGYELAYDPTSDSTNSATKGATNPDIAMDQAAEQEDDEAPLQKSSIGWVPYIFYSEMTPWLQVSSIIFLIVVASAGRTGLQFYLRGWSNSNGQHIAAWTGGYAAISIALLINTAMMLWQLSLAITSHSGVNIHAAEVKGLFGTAPSYFMTTPLGRIINRLSQDIFLVDFEFPIALVNGLSTFGILIGILILIVIPAPWLILMLLPLAVAYYITLRFYRTSKQLQHLEAASKSPLYTVFSTTLSGLECIRALHVQSHFEEQNDRYLDRSQKPFFFRFGGMIFLRTMLSGIAFIVAVSLASLAVGLRRSVDPSFLGLALSSLTNLSQYLSALLMSLALIENGTVAVSRIHEIATLPPEPDDAKDAITPVDWPQEGTVVFDNVQLRYRADLSPALRGIFFEVQGGQKIGICGRSGSGKSSLVLALLRALDESLTVGRILIDGIDTRSLPLGTLRKSLSLVAQEPFLWYSSIRENLNPEGDLLEKDMWAALQRVGMHDAVSTLPEKLDTVLEDEASLSRGQRQLLCLARVLLRKRKIVILDEASSSLDFETDEKMRQVVRTELADCTVLAVAHRIATIIDFDRIIVVDDGVIVESGSPAELLALPNGRFASLATSQGLILETTTT